MEANPIELFRDAIMAAGLIPPESIEGDGRIHRFASGGKAGDDAGWYVFHDGRFPAGKFGDWRTDISQTWSAKVGRKLSKEEDTARRASLRALQKERDTEIAQRHEAAAAKAEGQWARAEPATEDHGYLSRKGIKPHGTRVLADGRLAVPMFDMDGKLWNLERVSPEKPVDGSTDKKGLIGGRRTGCYFSIGNVEEAKVVCTAEGFATGSSIHEATGLPVVVAFNAGNLEPVSKEIRRNQPEVIITICADDDYRTKDNTGRTKAKQAALSVGAIVVSPVFQSRRPEGATDFNDLHLHEGLDAVRRIVLGAVGSQDAQPGNSKPDEGPFEAAGGTPSQTIETTDASGEPEHAADDGGSQLEAEPSPFPKPEGRPQYVVLDDWAEVGGRKWRPGVYFCYLSKEKANAPSIPVEDWFCSPLYVDAVTFDGQSNNFGRLLRFKNSIGQWREWAMPMELLRGAGDELRGELLAMGVELDPRGARQYLPAYLLGEHPKRRMRCALQVGWAGRSFVLPDEVIGPDAAGVIFQSGERGHEEHTMNLPGFGGHLT